MPDTREAFFQACAAGDSEAVRTHLKRDPGLALLREEGDNATPLHLAAAHGALECVGLLLDAGADPIGAGDLHDGGVIGWAAGHEGPNRDAVVALLLSRGARHHIFSAIAMDDPALVRQAVAADPGSLSRRRSRFEQGQTPLHFALASPNAIGPRTYGIARLLIELGADLEARDMMGRTPLTVAMLMGDLDAGRLLREAGAEFPEIDPEPGEEAVAELREAFYAQATPMLCVEDPDRTVAWYQSLGFVLTERVPERGPIGWGRLRAGKTDLMIQERVKRPRDQVALWFHTSRIDQLYAWYRSRQLRAMRARLAGESPPDPGVPFQVDLYDPFYGGREFSLADPSGVELVFYSE